MVRTCVDPTLDRLSKIEAYWGSDELSEIDADWDGDDDDDEAYRIKVPAWKRELRFLKMFLSCFVTWDISDPEIRVTMRSVHTAIEEIWEGSGDITTRILVARREACDQFASSFDGRIQQCKPLIEEYCHVLLESSLRCKSLTSDESIEFLDAILKNLKDLLSHKADKISTLKKQIGILQEQIELLVNFYVLVAHGCIDSKELRDFKACLQNFANNAACLTFLFWTKADANEQIMFTSKLNDIIADLRQKIIRLCAPDATALYMVSLKSIRLQGSHNTLLLGRVVVGFVDLHLKNLSAASKDDFQGLRDGLIFLLTFLTDPPQVLEGLILLLILMADPPEEYENHYELTLILNQIDALLTEGSYLLLSLEVMKADFTKRKTLLSDFVGKIEIMKGKIRRLYVDIPDSSFYNFPKTNGLGKFDHVLQNLKILNERQKDDTNLIPIAENVIIKIEEELVSLRPSLNDIFELQKVYKEFEDTWLQVIGLAYQTELFINLCSVDLHPVWYNMVCISYILQKIKIVKSMLEQVKIGMMYNIQAMHDSLPSISVSSERSRFPITDEEVVGFENEAKKIIDELIGGCKSLAIISVVGMGGLGKTTLANKVYNAKSVRYHFHKLAFCSVTQVHNTKKLLLDILSCLITINDKIHSMTVDVLAHQLWKCLSGQKYLVLMDDIWDITAWDEVKNSFPNDENGSRVIFTTRMANVALEAKSSIHHLCFMSEDESFELLQKKAFGKDGCPPKFSKFGKLMVKSCRGLPLAIVLVGSLLAKTEKSENWWNEIIETTSSYVFYEGCKDIIELSYKYLPEHLKACFLYLGIFSEDELIDGKTLKLLWIAEGFVNKPTNKSYRRVAKEYLSDLVDRNLVTVVKRTSRGAIRTCRLHDLVRDFCQRQAQEDNFLQLKNGYASSSFSNSSICYRYCVRGQTDGRSLNNVRPTVVSMHSLLYLLGNMESKAATDKLEFFCKDLKLVQVLHLKGIKVSLFSNKFQLVDLVHLRYIHVYVLDFHLIEIPESICNLWNLETFIWKSYSNIIKLPKTIWKMKRLRHLEGSNWILDLGDDDHKGGCQLDNMESFSTVILTDERTAREVLQRLRNIQKLSIHTSDTNPILPLELDFLIRLESLKLSYAKGLSVIFPSTLKRLFLGDCGEIPQELPCLEVLKIVLWKQKRWEVEDNKFPKLKYLMLAHCHLEQWDVSLDSFPCLEQLILEFCERLKEIPVFIGELPTLQRIEVYWCNDNVESSAIQIQKEQMENGSDIQLKIINFYRLIYV